MEINKDLYWIWLNGLKGIGPVTQRKLLYRFKDPYTIYNTDAGEIAGCEGIGGHAAELIEKGKKLDQAERILEKTLKDGIRLLSFYDELYPQEARDIHGSPTLLYYKGEIRKNSIGIGIVGSRRCSDYGKRVAKEAAEFLAQNGIAVISGMAKGIDGYAHTACLKAGGYTIAFLGNGLDICYPKEHESLMKSIVENGAVISQYPPGTRPLASNFPKRNMLISAWVKKLLVAEAAEDSGALITADYAFKLGREVYAVPNSIYSKESAGVNKLIQKGAKIYLNPSVLLEGCIDINKELIEGKSYSRTQLSNIELEIVKLIQEMPASIEEIIIKIHEDRSALMEALSTMELKGIVSILGGIVKLSPFTSMFNEMYLCTK